MKYNVTVTYDLQRLHIWPPTHTNYTKTTVLCQLYLPKYIIIKLMPVIIKKTLIILHLFQSFFYDGHEWPMVPSCV